jgi:hypothetical protein
MIGMFRDYDGMDAAQYKIAGRIPDGSVGNDRSLPVDFNNEYLAFLEQKAATSQHGSFAQLRCSRSVRWSEMTGIAQTYAQVK